MNYALADRNLLLTKGAHHRTELVEQLAKSIVTLKSATTSVSDLLLSKPLRLTALAMGNIVKERARNLIGDFMKEIEFPEKRLKETEGATVARTKPVLKLERP